MQRSRRSFLKSSALVGGVIGLDFLLPRGAGASVPRFGGPIPGFRDLVPTAAQNTGETLIALPPGFKYNVVIRRDMPMSDGRLFPSNADGMAAFDHDGGIRLVCNHERGAGTPIGALPWDSNAGGGTTTLTVDPVSPLLVESFVSSSGHIRNCAGGLTPWGSWLTCEESNLGPSNTSGASKLTKQHGYILEVPAGASGETAAEPLVHMGLHYPEAAVVDPLSALVSFNQRAQQCESKAHCRRPCDGAFDDPRRRDLGPRSGVAFRGLRQGRFLRGWLVVSP